MKNHKNTTIEDWCETTQKRFSQLNSTLDWGKNANIRESLFRMQEELDKIKRLAKQAKEEEQMSDNTKSGDAINPSHYKQYGVECKEFTKRLSWNQGNAIKYIWRCGLKDSSIQELRKSIWHLKELVNDHETLLVESQHDLVCLLISIKNMESWKTEILYLILNNDFMEAIHEIELTISDINAKNNNSHLHG